jgi:hypothetical protein
MKMLEEIATARKNYIHSTGRKPTHVVLSREAYALLHEATNPPVTQKTEKADDAEKVFGMEVVIDDAAFIWSRVSFARRP